MALFRLPALALAALLSALMHSPADAVTMQATWTGRIASGTDTGVFGSPGSLAGQKYRMTLTYFGDDPFDNPWTMTIGGVTVTQSLYYVWVANVSPTVVTMEGYYPGNYAQFYALGTTYGGYVSGTVPSSYSQPYTLRLQQSLDPWLDSFFVGVGNSFARADLAPRQLVVRQVINGVVVPVPAPGLLLLGAVAGLGWLRLRRLTNSGA
jgi:hypothetical protein